MTSAFSVSAITVSPSGSLTPGTQVTVTCMIQFTGSGETFPSENTLDLYTDLDNPKWNAVLVLNDIDNPQPLDAKKNVYLTGWILSYQSSDIEENLRLTLQGTAPSVTSTTEKIMLRIQELDSRNNVISSSVVTEKRSVINVAEINSLISTRESELQSLRTNIDEKAALEIDTAVAEQKYNDAQNAISSAKAKPASEYAAAKALLENAQTYLTEGSKELNKAWAEKDVSDAEIPITKTNELIVWLTPNATSGENKIKLTEIKTAKDIAEGVISTARDEIFAGNYDRAREKATEAFAKGNESYTNALELKKELSSGFNPLGMIAGLFKGSFVIIGVVIIIIVAVVGYIIYRKRTQWDELG